jgi:3-keto-5-aminohexanoate cleavage enzyme
MVPKRDRVPHVPVTPEQIVDDGQACFEAGATILHLHARDENEEPEWRREAYEAFIPELRRRCPGVVLCVTTSGRKFVEFEKRSDVLELEGAAKPDMASLTLGSLNFRDQASVNAPRTIERLAEAMAAKGIRPELEIFDTGMAYLAQTLVGRGLLDPPLYANLLLGAPNTAPAHARDLAFLVDGLPFGTVWAAAGIGAFQVPMNSMAVFMGGHVRTGLEDSPYFDFAARSTATNESLVRRVTETARIAGRPISTPDETRATLGLSSPVDVAPDESG